MTKNSSDNSLRDLQLLWERIFEILSSRATADVATADGIPALAGFFDTLTMVERDFVAAEMIKSIDERIKIEQPFTKLHFGILALVEPYIIRSNYAGDMLGLIRNEFVKFRTDRRSFEEYSALGLALASMKHRSIGGSDDWEAFYNKFSANPEFRYDAFDLALAATAATDIEAFSRVILSVPPDGWVIQRLFSFFPTLSRNHFPLDLGILLGDFLAKLNDTHQIQTKNDIIELARKYGLKIHSKDQVVTAKEKVVHVIHSLPLARPVPIELAFASGLISNERKASEIDDQELKQLEEALNQPTINIIRSGYTGLPVVHNFQIEFIQLIERLAKTANVHSRETENFGKLPPEISGRTKVIFAFPTYLTKNKRDFGYSVCKFGYHNELGVLYPAGNLLARSPNRPKFLKDLLSEVRRTNGRILCLENYAMAEIIRSEAEKDQNCRSYYNEARADDEHLVTAAPFGVHGNALIPRVPKGWNQNFVFVYDLAGHKQIIEMVSASTKKRHGGINLLSNAETDIISHDLKIPVGVGFTKFLVEWLLENDHWSSITEFVKSWSTRDDFREALESLGIYQETGTPSSGPKSLNVKSTNSRGA